MDVQQICILAAHIRSSPQSKSNVFTISTSMLSCLLSSFDLIEEQSTSFQIKQSHNFKVELLRDLQFLSNFFQQTKTLKLYYDGQETMDFFDITKFKNIISIEFCKVDVNFVRGLQGLRSQLQKLVCQKTSNSLMDVLSNCGGDKSQINCWNELKEVSFINNGINELDHSLECIPWLHTLDLSHNEITNFESLSCLPNLKHLNLSYNRLEAIPLLKGQICSRLQNLILKNNFIEDISGLRCLTNIWVLDLSNNCLVDHRSLLTLSYLATLQWLNLVNNPLSFHPYHRIWTASYLHLNTASTHFVLNHVALTKQEKKVVGSYHPLQASLNNSTESLNQSSEKVRKVRHVVIEDDNQVREINVPKLSASPQQYLETKKQIEILHEKYGESWLNSQSGLLVQNVLGLESSLPMSSSPYEADFTIYSGEYFNSSEKEPVKEPEKKEPVTENINEEYERNVSTPDNAQDDIDVEEESIYLATVTGETEPVFIVIGQTHLSEKECSTGNERDRWHVDSIMSCEILNDSKSVQVDFETMRKDRKQRIYVFEEEIEAFVACVKNKINSRVPKEENDVIKYQCMKCSTLFVKVRNESILGESAVKCPSCDSTLVVEDV